MVRVTRRRVLVLTMTPVPPEDPWMRRDYFPGIVDSHTRLMPPIEELTALLPNASVEPVPIPNGCTDGFWMAIWDRPGAAPRSAGPPRQLELAPDASGRSPAGAGEAESRPGERPLGRAQRPPARLTRARCRPAPGDRRARLDGWARRCRRRRRRGGGRRGRGGLALLDLPQTEVDDRRSEGADRSRRRRGEEVEDDPHRRGVR